MELFHEDGHMTDEGLQAVVCGKLSELESLEASEHLSFCGPCLEKYLALVETTELLSPETPLRESVMKRIGRKAKRVLFSRYATVAAAACLVLAMWGGGFGKAVMSGTLPNSTTDSLVESQSAAATREEPQPSLGTRVNRATNSFSELLNGWASALSPLPKEDPAPAAGTPTGGTQSEDRQDSSNSGSNADSDSSPSK